MLRQAGKHNDCDVRVYEINSTGANIPNKQDSWGCFGFDRTFGGYILRVGELFSVINGQNKLNANNVIKADFAPKAYALAA